MNFFTAVHRDINLHNILILEDKQTFKVKIADLGISKKLKDTKTCSNLTAKMNPNLWIAPEMLKGDQSVNIYDGK